MLPSHGLDSRNPKLIFYLNYLDLIDKPKIMINKWKLPALSLIGSVAINKMVVLPKCIFLKSYTFFSHPPSLRQ